MSNIYRHLVLFTLVVLVSGLAIDLGSILSPASPSTSTVSWQSAFFGLVPLALNAMTQSSDLDSGFSQSSLLFPSRSSPFVCLFDALEVLIFLGIHVFHGDSLRQSALLVNWQRARDRLGQNVQELEDVAAEKHPIAFGILFVVTVLQAVKIFAFKGLVWTKVWAGLYLSSYLVLALVGYLAPKDWRDNPPEIESRASFKTRMTRMAWILLSIFLAHLLLCCLVLDLTFWDAAKDAEEQPVWYWIVPLFAQTVICGGIIVFVLFLSIYAPFALLLALRWIITRLLGREPQIRMAWIDQPAWPDSQTRRGCCLRVLGLFIIFCIFYAIYAGYIFEMFAVFNKLLDWDAFEPRHPGVYFKVLRGGSNLSVCFMALWLFRSIMARLTDGKSSFERFNSLFRSHGAQIAFAGWNFLQALLYYCLRYDAQGTIKPSWTDKLG